MLRAILISAFILLVFSGSNAINIHSGDSMKMAYFKVDVTPPIGSPLAFGSVRSIHDSLSARGIILVFDDKPVVLCAVDWIGVSNDGLEVFRDELARAVGTTSDRVSIHALHLHDAVRCDFLVPKILDRNGNSSQYYDTTFLYDAIDRIAEAARSSLQHLQTVTDIGFGQAKVSQVASNRRILDKYGHVESMRWSNTKDFRLIRESEGLIDPWLKMVTLWDEDRLLVSMTYYAVHPVTDFGNGEVSAEFVGIARKFQEIKKGSPHIYFTGAAGNIGVGKYNNGSSKMRYVLASRMSMAMDEALINSVKKPVSNSKIEWRTRKVYLPLAGYMQKDSLELIVAGEKHDPELPYLRAVGSLAWWERVHKEPYVRISALRLGDVQLLSLPGEPFVEYQLAAQKFFPDQNICTAAYEEYGMGYIGTSEAYSQGGYETSKMASRVGPDSEKALLKAIKEVLGGN